MKCTIVGLTTKHIRFLFTSYRGQDPTENSLGDIKSRVHYRKITFDKEILHWLNTVLVGEQDWPAGMRKGMRDNLAHYRDLITYLINKQKGRQMNAEFSGAWKSPKASNLYQLGARLTV